MNEIRETAAAVTALQQAATYPHPVTTIDHLETHISHVFLAGDYAYKLKKPVDFGFLDFTTLDKRRAACRDEVRLNRRLAPDWYLGVLSLCRTAAGGRLRAGCADGASEMDTVVHMRRLPQDGLLDRLATAGRLDIDSMSDVARQLAAFHANAERGPSIEHFGRIESILAPAIQNFEQTEPYLGTVLPPESHRRLRAATEEFLTANAGRFAARCAAHRIVDGHGDLHLRNMCRVDGRVVIFDCIEFNTALRAGDVMNDIAFLTMDLDHRALPAHGNRFLNEYLEQSDDYAGLPLLDYYQAYRACVRAKVSCLGIPQDPSLAAEAAQYFELAGRYFAARRGGILVTCGVSGSGKSTLARDVAREIGAVTVRSDAVRKHLGGVPLTARAEAGLYSREMTERTYGRLQQHAREIVASGRWAIMDAVHAHRSERAAAANLARELGVPFGILYCEAPPAELRRRLTERAGRDVSDANVAVMEQQLGFFEAPEPAEGPLVVWTGGAPPADWIRQLTDR